LHARHGHGVRRIAVVDFDVHHGNGTQAAFWNDADLFYGSTHQWPLYPGTGSKDERGLGNILNLPLAPFSGSKEFRAAYTGELIPALEDFKPELVLISAGFDAHAADPLANLNLHEGDFAWATEQLAIVADQFAGKRLVSTLEGGYDLAALRASARAHVLALMRQS
jgi:acetoin utilization deacetylase AcuC-like enzyme